MLEAHIDTLGAIVTEIKSNGRLKVSPIGGMNANNAEAETAVWQPDFPVHLREPASFQTLPSM